MWSWGDGGGLGGCRGAQITMEMYEKKRSEYRQGCHYYFFIHYFHNDCHYAPGLWLNSILPVRFVASRNNYHLSDVKIHAKHFHGQSLHMFGREKRKRTLWLFWKGKKKSCENLFQVIRKEGMLPHSLVNTLKQPFIHIYRVGALQTKNITHEGPFNTRLHGLLLRIRLLNMQIQNASDI